jgi:hypothetical protein
VNEFAHKSLKPWLKNPFHAFFGVRNAMELYYRFHRANRHSAKVAVRRARRGVRMGACYGIAVGFYTMGDRLFRTSWHPALFLPNVATSAVLGFSAAVPAALCVGFSPMFCYAISLVAILGHIKTL